MPLNFPSAPSANTTYTFSGKSWTYNGNAWAIDSTTLTTNTVVEGSNFYFTNARVYSAVTGNLALKANVIDLTTANVSELTNLYYTDARVYSAVTGNLALKANVVDLTTANVAEINNLYFTNARVYANVTERLANLNTNVLPSVSEVFSLGSPTKKFKDLYLSGNTIILGTTTLSSSEEGLTVDSIRSNVWGGLYTANVVETSNNLFYTNARVYSAVTGNLTLKANVVDLTTANVIELTNLYYTNARVYSAVVGNLALKANVVDLTTSNVSELTNLYFTNARARASISVSGSGTYDSSTGIITVTGGVSSVGGASGAVSNAQLASGITSSGLLTTSNVTEGTNFYYSNARVYANIAPLLANVSGGATVYFQNTTPSVPTSGSIWINSDTGKQYLYFDDDSSSQWVEQLTGTFTYNDPTGLTTANVTELTNLYYTNARVYSAVTGNLTLKANVVDLTTANVAELTNLYYTNARVVTAISSQTFANATFSGNITIGNVSTTGTVTAQRWSGLYTSNVVGLGSLATANTVANTQITGVITGTQLANTAVTATTYGGASSIPVIVVDQQGRIISAANVAISIPEAGFNPFLLSGM